MQTEREVIEKVMEMNVKPGDLRDRVVLEVKYLLTAGCVNLEEYRDNGYILPMLLYAQALRNIADRYLVFLSSKKEKRLLANLRHF